MLNIKGGKQVGWKALLMLEELRFGARDGLYEGKIQHRDEDRDN